MFFASFCKQACNAFKKQNPSAIADGLFLLSGWQDSNLRPSGPKPDALTGLRYTPKIMKTKVLKNHTSCANPEKAIGLFKRAANIASFPDFGNRKKINLLY
jgi:hypothetical protein